MSDRLIKVNELIAKELAPILQQELDLEGDIFITVVRVQVSRTLEHATVWISILPETQSETILEEINKHIYEIQQIINKRLILRKVPKLLFKLDTTEQHAERIENLLESIVE